MSEIRELSSVELYDYIKNNQHAYPTFYSGTRNEKETLKERYEEMFENSSDLTPVGYFLEDNQAGDMMLLEFEMNYCGELVKIGGVASIAVNPLFKKKGIAKDLVQYALDWSRRKGHLFHILYPFNAKFYKNFNYGYTIPLYHYSFHPDAIKLAPISPKLNWIEGMDRIRMLNFHKEMVENTPGLVQKSTLDRRRILIPESLLGIYYESEGKLEGYMTYEVKANNIENILSQRIEIKELQYKDGNVLRELLNFLTNQRDQFERIDLSTYDPNFYLLLEDISFAASVKLNNPISHKYAEVGTTLMVQALDIKRACEMATNEAFTLEVPSQRIMIDKYDINGGGPLVKIDLSILSSLLFGAVSIENLVKLGIIDSPEKPLSFKIPVVKCDAIF